MTILLADNIWSDAGQLTPHKDLIRELFAGILTGQEYVVAGADYPVVTGDAGVSLVQTGSAFKNFSFGPVASYRNSHANLCINKSSRLLKVSPNLLTSQILFPDQCCLVANLGGTGWYMTPAGRYRGDVTLQTDPDLGNDMTGDGLAAGPGALATVTAAWNRLRDYTDGAAEIQLKPGAIYPPQAELVGDNSGNYGRLVLLSGDPTFANQPIIRCTGGGQTGLTFRDGGWGTVNGLTFDSSGSGSVGVQVQQKALADFLNCTWGAMAGGAHLEVNDGGESSITGIERITGGSQIHWDVVDRGKIIVGGTTIDGRGAASAFSVAFALVSSDAWLQLQSPTFFNTSLITGSRYLLAHHAVAEAGGMTLPGDSAGSADATSNYY